MALSGKLIGYVEISKKGDYFHNLLRYNPNELTVICPDKILGCDLLAGERGAVGSVVLWHYTQDGKRKIAKGIIEAVNEENQMIVFKFIEGELAEIYKSFTKIFHVEQKGGRQVATWTVEFEKPDTSVPYPTSIMDFLCNVVKDMDTYDSTK